MRISQKLCPNTSMVRRPVPALEPTPATSPWLQRALRARSPQPMTAAAARKAAARQAAERLAADDSPYALCPDEPERLGAMVTEAASIRDEGIPQGTKGADETGFKAVKRFCQSINTPWMRPRVCDRPDEERESWFYALALLAVVCAIKPGAKQAARGVTQGKPSSGLGYLYAFRRVQLDCGRYVPSLNLMLSEHARDSTPCFAACSARTPSFRTEHSRSRSACYMRW